MGGNPKNEPVAWASVVRVLIALAASFGFQLTGEQTAAVITAVEVIAVLIVRARVTPNHLADSRAEQGLRPSDPREEISK